MHTNYHVAHHHHVAQMLLDYHQSTSLLLLSGATYSSYIILRLIETSLQ